MSKQKERPAMKCERRKVKIPISIMNTLKPLYKNPTETGGGFKFNDKGKISNVYYFMSDSDRKIKFDEVYDVEFHAHPLLGKTKRHLLTARRASASDIASTFVSGSEEIVFTKGYCFVVRIVNRNLFEQTKKFIRNRYKGRKFESVFFLYREFFKEQEQIIVNKYNDDVKLLNDEWNKELTKYGIEVTRMEKNNAIEMNVHGKCTVPNSKTNIGVHFRDTIASRFKDRKKGRTT